MLQGCCSVWTSVQYRLCELLLWLQDRNPESSELEKLFARLDSNETVQRRNALDVLAELLSISTKNTDTIDSTLRSSTVYLSSLPDWYIFFDIYVVFELCGKLRVYSWWFSHWSLIHTWFDVCIAVIPLQNIYFHDLVMRSWWIGWKHLLCLLSLVIKFNFTLFWGIPCSNIQHFVFWAVGPRIL